MIAKGQKITKGMKQKLWKLNTSSEDGKTQSSTLNKNILVSDCSEKIAKKFSHIESSTLEEASEVLNRIIFGSKLTPWQIFICALSNYLDWLYTHSINVALISTLLSIKLKEGPEKQEQICLGALLHDIGKLLIPKKILNQQDGLNGQDNHIVQQHCELGYDMVTELNLPKPCAEIVLQHHERLDGSGYPHKIRGNQISDFAKAVMIADVLDNMTSYRPYRGTQDIQDGIHTLLNEKSKFDLNDVKVLLKCLGNDTSEEYGRV